MAKLKDSNSSMPNKDDNTDDIFDFVENFTKAATTSQKIFNKCVEMQENNDNFNYFQDWPETYSKIAKSVMENPEKFYSDQIDLYANYAKAWNNALGRYLGNEEEPLFKPNPKDKRFQDTTWDKDAVFDFIKQSYVVTSDWIQQFTQDFGSQDDETAKKFKFYSKQFIDALCPSNFAFTNPEVIKQTLEKKGENIAKGMENLLHDLENSKNFLNISTTKSDHFEIGKNIATTPGKVIYQNELMQLIQYSPTQSATYSTPLLIIPAWINKYYILDLSEHNSLVRWIVDKGYTVFMISWVNPDKQLANTEFEDYMVKGPLTAIEKIKEATGSHKVTAMGYCLGGTLLACTLSYLASKGQSDKISAATLLTTMVDFSNVGDMSIFIDKKLFEQIKQQMLRVGYFDGEEMSAIFSVLRSNDLIWSFVINNYLMGREPFPFDILYWNSDSTRLPAKAHSFYLENMYIKNALKDTNGINLGGNAIDVSQIKTPSYIFSAYEDHIAPWKTTYKTMSLFNGKRRFVLSDSGHVASVINPPSKNKYCYWLNDRSSNDPDEWLKAAQQHKGSWWNDWEKWNRQFSGPKTNAPIAGQGKMKALEEAPGSYAKA